ncbi:hypothetical protein Dsin_026831 [Dipteronia sinensis]|uniref:Ubiquitin-like protease family profile domain-containing protein n=1 Tax=Dipteronia sinensis TaxID=43782 RepID=A0AAD9ZYM0_9ROSI|nr:hypothetical protein Dsin_026831 [Dipteronia sinensis]
MPSSRKEYLVGLERQIKEIESLLSLDFNTVCIVGICGIGGSECCISSWKKMICLASLHSSTLHPSLVQISLVIGCHRYEIDDNLLFGFSKRFYGWFFDEYYATVLGLSYYHSHNGNQSDTSMLQWERVQVPMQSTNVECGYYVLRFMKDIITDSSVLTENFHGKRTYTQKEINEVRDEWMLEIKQMI